jgi:hypothetical protein
MALENAEMPKWILSKQAQNTKKFFPNFIDPAECLFGIVVHLPSKK